MKITSTHTYRILGVLIAILLINVLSYAWFARFDLTADQRYTLSAATHQIIDKAEKPVIIDVFLAGDFPPEFRKLQQETRQLLEEFSAENPRIKYQFVDPLEEGQDANAVATQFYEMGMTPARINVVENGRSSESVIFPWAMANYGKRSVSIPLLKNQLGATTEDRVEASVQQLEYAFANALRKLMLAREKKIAVMRGNGELPDAHIADFVKSIQEYYFIAPFTLDSAEQHPQRTLDQLKTYDLVIEAKPTEPYTEKEKYILDQYLMNGGKKLWMVEHVAMETDSLFSKKANAFALPRDLNLGDYFFKYGVRVNPFLVKDLYSAPIVLASGSGSNTQFVPYPWPYFPLSSSPMNHPVVNNVEAVRFEYASPIDTLANSIQKTVLLSSSPRSKLEGLPREISLDQVNQKPDPEAYNEGEQPLAVLLEGKFPSVYEDRIKPFDLEDPKATSDSTQVLVISDGDIVKNELRRGKPAELGFDRYTGTTYGNKEFLVNAVNYLLDDQGIVSIRSKEVSIAFLDLQEADEDRLKWQVINLVLPLGILALFGIGYIFYRRRSYTKH